MQPLGTTLRAVLGAHPALMARLRAPLTPQERSLIDDMLAASLGLEHRKPTSGALRTPGETDTSTTALSLDDIATRPPTRLRWWIRERVLVVAVTDQSLFAMGRFMLRELGHQLATLGHPGGATSVKFVCAPDEASPGTHPAASNHRSGADGLTIQRQPSANAARDLRLAAELIDDHSLALALRRLARRLDPVTSPDA